MRKKLLFKKMVKSKGLAEPLVIYIGEPCPKCGVDEWGNIMFCTCASPNRNSEDISSSKKFY